MFLRIVSTFVFSLLGVNAAYGQAAIEWDAVRAIAMGTGCSSVDNGTRATDTYFLANGNDLSIVFSALGIEMPGGTSSQLAMRKNCSIRVPARVAGGHYIGELAQTISYGVTKSRRSDGAIAVRSTFYGYNLQPLTAVAPYGSQINQPLITARRSDLFLVHTHGDYIRRWCRTPEGNYTSNIVVSGRRDSRQDDLIMYTDALDLRFDVLVGLSVCPL